MHIVINGKIVVAGHDYIISGAHASSTRGVRLTGDTTYGDDSYIGDMRVSDGPLTTAQAVVRYDGAWDP